MKYVITQNFDAQTTHHEVAQNLVGKYELLARCDWFKQKFDEHAKDSGVTTILSTCQKALLSVCYAFSTNTHSEFYFNYAGSILRELTPTLTSGGSPFPFLHFIATPLLPCGKVDSKVRKFTGNENFRNTCDNLTRAIHPFVHFSMVYSNRYILFCDMQGELLIFHSITMPHY